MGIPKPDYTVVMLLNVLDIRWLILLLSASRLYCALLYVEILGVVVAGPVPGAGDGEAAAAMELYPLTPASMALLG